MQHLKLLFMSPLLPPLCITICTTVRNIFDISLLVELLIYSEKCFLVQQNKTYSYIYKSIIITSPIGFKILRRRQVETTLYQRCNNVLQRCFDVCNVVSMLFQRCALTLYQRCETLKIRCRILFHFQRPIYVISTLIQNVEMLAGYLHYLKKP